MKKILLLIFVSLAIAGCVSINQQATLTTQNPNISKSIKDLELQQITTKKVNDLELNANLTFTYQASNPDSIEKIMIETKSNPKYIYHLIITDNQITQVKQEIHTTEGDQTNLINHSYKVEENKVVHCMFENAFYLMSDDPRYLELKQEVEQLIQYVNSTYLNEA